MDLLPNFDTNENLADEKVPMVLHVLRNPYGKSGSDVKNARLYAAKLIEQFREAYLNMREFAEASGLDTATRGGKLMCSDGRIPTH